MISLSYIFQKFLNFYNLIYVYYIQLVKFLFNSLENIFKVGELVPNWGLGYPGYIYTDSVEFPILGYGIYSSRSNAPARRWRVRRSTFNTRDIARLAHYIKLTIEGIQNPKPLFKFKRRSRARATIYAWSFFERVILGVIVSFYIGFYLMVLYGIIDQWLL